MLIGPMTILLLAVMGIATGLAGAVLGTGGGVFLIPLLVLCFDVPMHFAVGTSILSVIATSTAVASTNVERGTANMRLGMTLEIATSLGAISGGLTAAWLPSRMMQALFGFVLIPTAIMMWRGAKATVDDEGETELAQNLPISAERSTGRLGGEYRDPRTGRNVRYRIRRLWAGMGVAFVAGILSGLLGIGGGVFKVPAINLLCGVPIKAAAATSNFMIGVTAAASAFLYFGRGQVSPVLTASVVLGVVVGSAIGMYVNRFARGVQVKRLFAVLLVGVAAEMLVSVFLTKG